MIIEETCSRSRPRSTSARSGWSTPSGWPPSSGPCPAPESIASVAEVFALLGDENRLRLLLGLLEGGELCVCDLAAAAGLGESATSHALRLLRAHRVVKVRRAGRRAYYSLTDGHVRMLLDLAVEHEGHDDA